jgi:hypothetical protein
VVSVKLCKVTDERDLGVFVPAEVVKAIRDNAHFLTKMTLVVRIRGRLVQSDGEGLTLTGTG